jgi:hypothetical protein
MLRSVLMILVVCIFASMPCVGAPTLSITPRQGLIDEPLMIEVDGLAAGQTFVIRAVMRVDAQTMLASHGLFRADDHGHADSRFSAEHLTFREAGHIINFPFMPASTRTQLGGTVEGLARADRESWEKVVAFLSKNLEPNKTR